VCRLFPPHYRSMQLSPYSHIIERLDERMKQDSHQYCIWHLLVHLIPLTPVLVILVLYHINDIILQIIILHALLTAIIHKKEDMYVAECPEIGTVSQGKTIVVS